MNSVGTTRDFIFKPVFESSFVARKPVISIGVSKLYVLKAALFFVTIERLLAKLKIFLISLHTRAEALILVCSSLKIDYIYIAFWAYAYKIDTVLCNLTSSMEKTSLWCGDYHIATLASRDNCQ